MVKDDGVLLVCTVRKGEVLLRLNASVWHAAGPVWTGSQRCPTNLVQQTVGRLGRIRRDAAGLARRVNAFCLRMDAGEYLVEALEKVSYTTAQEARAYNRVGRRKRQGAELWRASRQATGANRMSGRLGQSEWIAMSGVGLQTGATGNEGCGSNLTGWADATQDADWGAKKQRPGQDEIGSEDPSKGIRWLAAKVEDKAGRVGGWVGASVALLFPGGGLAVPGPTRRCRGGVRSHERTETTESCGRRSG